MRKTLLLISIALLGISLNTNAQKVAAGPRSYSTYYICDNPGYPMALGYNIKGQLGDGTVTDRSTPVAVSGLSDITSMAGGMRFSLFLKSDGTVWSSGDNASGQLGDGTYTGKLTPVQVNSLSGITAIAAGDEHSLFLKNDGTVWGSGSNNKGQLGQESGVNNVNTPMPVAGLTDITAVAAGDRFSLFLKGDGTVWASGNNFAGQLGDASTTARPTPVQVSGLSGIIGISAAKEHSLFLKDDGTVWACGRNNLGQLGDQSFDDKYSPVQVPGLEGISAVSGGGSFSLFLKNDGSVWSCGSNNSGALGNGTTIASYIPVQVSDMTDAVAIAAGSSHSLFVKSNGSIWGCGSNTYGALGEGNTNHLVPVEVISASDCSGTSLEEVGNQFSKLMVYPNPSANSIFIKTASDIVPAKQLVLKIYNATGQEVLQFLPKGYKEIQAGIDISTLSSGIYFISLFDGENQGHAKFFKE